MCDKCDHVWKQIEKPITEALPWFRCEKCGAYGYARSVKWNSKFNRVLLRLCGVRGCQAIAVAPIDKRSFRGAVQWRCLEHQGCQSEKPCNSPSESC